MPRLGERWAFDLSWEEQLGLRSVAERTPEDDMTGRPNDQTIPSSPSQGASLEARSRRFNETTGSLYGGNQHPDRCVCQEKETGPNAGTPHKHYSEPPYGCARCSECKGYEPAVPTPQTPVKAETLEARIEAALKDITPGAWKYRPLDFDDWGFVRSEIGDELVAIGRCSLPESEADRHRAGGTDPFAGNAKFIAAAPQLLRDALAEIRKAKQAVPGTREPEGWQPIATCPRHVTRALICWPAFELNEDLEQSNVRRPENDLVSEGFRVGGTQWECDMVTEHFEDEAGFGYGEPTHWRPLPEVPHV